MLEEIGEPYGLTVMTWEEGSGEEHRARHPLRRAFPSLKEHGSTRHRHTSSTGEPTTDQRRCS